MAEAKNGPLGPFSGKLGPLNGYVLRGKGYLRARRHITKPSTEKQLAVQQRMKVLSPFFNLIKLYLRVGFQLSAVKNDNSANNSAKSYNLVNAIKGLYPLQEMDFPNVRLTEGNLAIPLNPLAIAAPGGIRFSWAYNEYDVQGSGFDRTMLMAYFPGKNLAFFVISGKNRMQLEEELFIPLGLTGLEAETYISFITNDRAAISNSVYTGKVMME